MEAKATELCNFCVGLIPFQESSLNRAHHPNLGLLEQSSQTCLLCRVFLGSWSLQYAQEKFPDIDDEAYKSIAFSIKMKGVQQEAPELSWALVETNILVQGYCYVYDHSITSCGAKCMLSSFQFPRSS
jgi:hypothetical protein